MRNTKNKAVKSIYMLDIMDIISLKNTAFIDDATRS